MLYVEGFLCGPDFEYEACPSVALHNCVFRDNDTARAGALIVSPSVEAPMQSPFRDIALDECELLNNGGAVSYGGCIAITRSLICGGGQESTTGCVSLSDSQVLEDCGPSCAADHDADGDVDMDDLLHLLGQWGPCV